MTYKCLLTGNALSEATNVEHTLPKKLGGRIKSQRVVSSDVNNKFSFFDSVFSDAFSNVLIELGPAMAGEHRLRPLQVVLEGEEGRFYVESGNVLTERGMNIVEKDERTGRPIRFTADSEEELERIAKEMNAIVEPLGATFRERQVPVTRRIPAIDPQLEVAVLKALIFSFDHFLSQTGSSIVRSAYFERVLETFKAVAFRKRDYGDLLIETSWGVDHNWGNSLGEFAKMNFSPNLSEFTHWFYLVGDSTTKAIYIALSVFGFETYRFLINRNYQDPDFLYVIANDPIRNGEAVCKSVVGPLPALGVRTRICAGQIGNWTEAEREFAIHLIDQGRRHLAQRACLFVNENCDDHVAQCLLKQAARVNWKLGKAATFSEVLVEHLWIQYEDRYNSESGISEIQRLVSSCITDSSMKHIANLRVTGDESDSFVIEKGLLELYRFVLKSIVREKGDPGAYFQSHFSYHNYD